MTIRITCAECASVLKIKDELAGTSARCPKCKTKFVVPNLEQEKPIELELAAKPAETAANASDDPHRTDPAADSPTGAEANSEALDGLDDSDLSAQDSAEHATDSNSQQPKTGSEPSEWSDDDLDSPPVLVSDQSTESRADPVPSTPDLQSPPTETKKKRGRNDVFENALQNEANAKNARAASKKNSDQAFDPVQFLMDDSAGPRENPFSAGMQDDSDLSLPDDSDYEVPSRPTPIPARRGTPPVVAARPTPEKVDLASAAKMMKKAIKDAQTDSVRQRQLDENPKFDYTLFFREIGLRGLAIIVGCVLLVVGSIYLSNAIFRTTLKTPPLGFVRGVITLDGKPVSNAYIVFNPKKPLDQLAIKGTSRDRERASIGVSDSQGNFKMMYSRDEMIEGVAVGKCHVWVEHNGPQGSDVPFPWTQGAFTEVEVKLGSQPPFNIAMVTEGQPTAK